MSRLKEPFTDDIRQLMRQVQYIKNRQYIGKDSILGYRTTSLSTYDISTSLAASQVSRTYLVTVTHASGRANLIKMYPFLSQNSAVIANYIPPWAVGVDVVMKTQKLTPRQDAYTQWYVGIYNGTPFLDPVTPIYAKFIFEGTDTGTIAVSEVI